MKHEIFVVAETNETDEFGNPIYINRCWDVKGNSEVMRAYARKHHYGAGVKMYAKVHHTTRLVDIK